MTPFGMKKSHFLVFRSLQSAFQRTVDEPPHVTVARGEMFFGLLEAAFSEESAQFHNA